MKQNSHGQTVLFDLMKWDKLFQVGKLWEAVKRLDGE